MKILALAILLLTAPSLYASDDVFSLSKITHTELINMYWDCDILSNKIINNERTSNMSMALCGSVSGEIRERFFNDDFVLYLKWVEDNKTRAIKRNPPNFKL